MTQPDDQPVAMVTGGSEGLGWVVAKTFLQRGYRVMIVGRDATRIDNAIDRLENAGPEITGKTEGRLIGQSADVTKADEIGRAVRHLEQHFGRLDALVNCVGRSDRGLVEKLAPEHLDELLRLNVHTALLCSQAALPMLERSGGVIVNLGSLAAKVGARYIGGYAAAKHALAGMTQQLRLELKPRGVHVALVSPGPIRRDDAGTRYQDRVDASLPAQASRPGGGTRIGGLDPQRVADAVLRCVEKRRPDIVLPGYLRILIAIGHAFPRLGDWLLLKFTSSGSEDR